MASTEPSKSDPVVASVLATEAQQRAKLLAQLARPSGPAINCIKPWQMAGFLLILGGGFLFLKQLGNLDTGIVTGFLLFIFLEIMVLSGQVESAHRRIDALVRLIGEDRLSRSSKD